jgi:hypothetical protein
MDQLHTRLDALEQQMHTVTRRLRWWRDLAGGLAVLAELTWALPAVIAQEEATEKGQKGLAQRVAALEELLTHFSREQNEIFITGANLHLVNGLGSTDCTDEQFEPIPDCPNGLGNLIVGYNEPREIELPPEEGTDNSGEDPNVRTGSHNVVVGQQHNFSRFGGIVVGVFNTISGDFAAVSGGSNNTASGVSASVSGGGPGADPILDPGGNTASGEHASVCGGHHNGASGAASTVCGGAFNGASGEAATVCGGQNNGASNFAASVSGGLSNTASGFSSTVSGGFENTAIGQASVVSGGGGNTASGQSSVVSGGGRNFVGEGVGNTASGENAVVSGGQNITQDTEFGWSAGSEAEEVVVGNVRSP